MPDATERMTLDEYKRMRDGKLPPMRVEPGAQTKEDLRRESELQRDCENELSLRGIEYLHLSIKARERKGWPDLTFSVPFHREGWRCPTCCARGRHYAVELKTATGRLSDDQKRVLARMQANGWLVRVVRTFEDFRALIGGDLGAGEKLPPDAAKSPASPEAYNLARGGGAAASGGDSGRVGGADG